MKGQFEIVKRRGRDELGEGPIWSPSEQAIYWVDIMKPAVHRLTLRDGAIRSWTMPEMIGWVIERAHRPGFIAGFASGFAELTLDPLAIKPIGDPEPELPNNRMNDAKVDAVGRIWAGTMDTDAASPVGSLYRLDPDHRWHRMDQGYQVTNGPTFSPDGKLLYHTDSYGRTIYRFELRPDGTLAEKKSLITFTEEMGYPDGMTTDIEGCLWVTHFGGGRVTRYSPQGKVVRIVPLPASQITSCVFGGPDLDRMFVTSAYCGLTDAALASEAQAGALFEIDPGVRGIAPVPFAG